MTARTVTAYVIACDAHHCDVVIQGPDGDLFWRQQPSAEEVDLEIAVSNWSGTDEGDHYCPDHGPE